MRNTARTMSKATVRVSALAFAAVLTLALGCLFAAPHTALASDSALKANSAQSAVSNTNNAAKNTLNTKAAKVKGVTYWAHEQQYGWLNVVSNGKSSGKAGKGLRMEALCVKLENMPYSGGIKYRTYVESKGWTGWKSNGKASGTVGKKLRTEALQIKLTGKIAKEYDVYYRVYAQGYGWMNWTKNGGYAGTLDRNKRLEAVKIKLVEKDDDGPSTSSKAFRPKYYTNYQVFSQTVGWLPSKSDGKMAGTTGAKLGLRAFELNLVDLGVEGDVVYNVHLANEGWDKPVLNGETAGMNSLNAPQIEAFRMSLAGELSELYDLYYCVYVEKYGWMGWAKNGKTAGTTGYGLPVEAVKVKLVKKGGAAPGSTKMPSRIK